MTLRTVSGASPCSSIERASRSTSDLVTLSTRRLPIAGETWTRVNSDPRVLARPSDATDIRVHPTNPDIVFVAGMGHPYGPNDERGVFRTTNGGRTWEKVLFVDQNTGCSGLQLSKQDPNVVIAGTWEIELQTHVLHSGGMGSGIHLSRDNGKTFTKVAAPGLPKSPYGKTDVAIAPSNGNFPPGQFPSGNPAQAPGQSTPNEVPATNPSND